MVKTEEVTHCPRCNALVVMAPKNVTRAGVPHICNSLIISTGRSFGKTTEIKKIKENNFFERILEKNRPKFI